MFLRHRQHGLSKATFSLDKKTLAHKIKLIIYQKSLSGFRETPPLDKKKFAEILIALGKIGLLYPRIKEVNINPMILTASGAVAVDATIILE